MAKEQHAVQPSVTESGNYMSAFNRVFLTQILIRVTYNLSGSLHFLNMVSWKLCLVLLIWEIIVNL